MTTRTTWARSPSTPDDPATDLVVISRNYDKLIEGLVEAEYQISARRYNATH